MNVLFTSLQGFLSAGSCRVSNPAPLISDPAPKNETRHLQLEIRHFSPHGLSWVRRNLELCHMSATRRTSRKRSIVLIDARTLGLWWINDGYADMRIVAMRPSMAPCAKRPSMSLTGHFVSLTGLDNCPASCDMVCIDKHCESVTNWKSDAHGQLAAWIGSVAVV